MMYSAHEAYRSRTVGHVAKAAVELNTLATDTSNTGESSPPSL
jgi:hypothetical protein